MSIESLIYLVIALVVGVLVITLFRNLMLMYFGIYEIHQRMDRIIQLLENNHTTTITEQPQPTPKKPSPYDLTP